MATNWSIVSAMSILTLIKFIFIDITAIGVLIFAVNILIDVFVAAHLNVFMECIIIKKNNINN